MPLKTVFWNENQKLWLWQNCQKPVTKGHMQPLTSLGHKAFFNSKTSHSFYVQHNNVLSINLDTLEQKGVCPQEFKRDRKCQNRWKTKHFGLCNTWAINQLLPTTQENSWHGTSVSCHQGSLGWCRAMLSWNWTERLLIPYKLRPVQFRYLFHSTNTYVLYCTFYSDHIPTYFQSSILDVHNVTWHLFLIHPPSIPYKLSDKIITVQITWTTAKFIYRFWHWQRACQF